MVALELDLSPDTGNTLSSCVIFFFFFAQFHLLEPQLSHMQSGKNKTYLIGLLPVSCKILVKCLGWSKCSTKESGYYCSRREGGYSWGGADF